MKPWYRQCSAIPGMQVGKLGMDFSLLFPRGQWCWVDSRTSETRGATSTSSAFQREGAKADLADSAWGECVAVPSVQSTASSQLRGNPRCVGEKTREENAFF